MAQVLGARGMILSNPFTRRVRGFRIIDLAGLVLVLVLAFVSYTLKTLAGSQGANTADVESQIAQEDRRIRLLRADITHLEDPERVEHLAVQYLGLQAVDPKHEATIADLGEIARRGAPPPTPLPDPACANPAAPLEHPAPCATGPAHGVVSGPPADAKRIVMTNPKPVPPSTRPEVAR